MKKLLAIFVVVCAVVNLGCEPPIAGRQNQPQISISEPSKADEAVEFPAVMVGVWETKPSKHTGKKWGVKFESDGSVRKIVHYLAGPVDLAEGGALLEGSDPNQEYALFVIEECPVKYDSETRVVEVEIIVASYTIKKPGFSLDGHMTDRFSGPVSEDGKIWKTERRTYAELDGTMPLSDEFVDAHPTEAIFYRIEDIPGTK
ncbi:MAG: hypothetical protein ACYTFK_06100 [Planctomycetota bacterium]